MDQAERRIRSLKLRGPDDSHVLQLRYRLEEAFRIASLPGLPPNAMVLIRRLDLGAIRSGMSSVQLADRISEKARSLAAEAICIDQHARNNAGVVWFSDPLRPYQALLLRLLDGKATTEWYWRSLFPNQTLSLNEQLIAELMTKACQTPVKGLAVSLLIQSCLEPLRLSRLLMLVTTTLVRRLLQEQGMSPVALSVTPVQKPNNQASAFSESSSQRWIEAPNLSIAWRSALQTVAEYWGHNDVRSKWLALQALLCHRPAYLERRDTWHHIELAYWLEAWSIMQPEVNRVQSNRPEAAIRSPESDCFSDKHRDSGQNPSAVRSGERQESRTGPGHFSHHAGFALLIPLLQRLGMAELLQHQDALLAVDFPRQLLWTMATRFVLNKADPARHLFKDIETTPRAVTERFYAPALWWRLADESRCCTRCLTLQATALRVDELSNAFQFVCALYLRRHCDLSLRGLIQRPGRVAITKPHWDVMFHINQTDLRLRRVALDSDPGWVPWLGRVVQFHYDSEGQNHV